MITRGSRAYQVLAHVIKHDGKTRAQIEAETGPGTAQILTALQHAGLVRKQNKRSSTWHATPSGFVAWDALLPL